MPDKTYRLNSKQKSNLNQKSGTVKKTLSSTHNIIAESYYHKTLLTKGWNKLSITTYNNANLFTQAFLAGYIEGRQTFEGINDFYFNMKNNNLSSQFGDLFEELKTFYKKVI